MPPRRPHNPERPHEMKQGHKYRRPSKRSKERAASQPPSIPLPYGDISKLDKRSGVFKILRARFESIVTDLGGHNNLTHLQYGLIDRAVFVLGLLDTLESEIRANGIDRPGIMERWAAANNQFLGLCKLL